MKQKMFEMVQVSVPIFFILMQSKKSYGPKNLILTNFWKCSNNVKKCMFFVLPRFLDFIELK